MCTYHKKGGDITTAAVSLLCDPLEEYLGLLKTAVTRHTARRTFHQSITTLLAVECSLPRSIPKEPAPDNIGDYLRSFTCRSCVSRMLCIA